MAPNRSTPQSSSGSYDGDDVGLHPLPLPLLQLENGGSDGSDEEESDDEMGKNEVPTKNLLLPPPLLDEVDGSDEEESDDEMGKNEVPTKNLLLPPPQGTEVPDEVADSEDDFDEVGDSESESDEVPPKPALPSKPQQKKRKAPAARSPQLKSKIAQHGHAESNVEKLFKDKCASYWFLAKEVSALEAKQPGMFKVPFLKLADDKAHTLDTKIKKQTVAKIKVHMRRGDIEKEVTNTLINLLK